ncbi:Alpha-D-kanosaminyltransferase [Paraburkholderia domus]|uniref:glycosyltransferase family 4 protein n=1 Tax=Paraburkholderia domus TaxID=2793075 RepID=UPI001911F3B0|nr:glycosyltransferase family 4 protein [Paraburkholderia domus]MBK5060036.1 glycosyltransferase family 4 protein [Burkholderia sp. R-70199]MBK5085333.1 glycosyltransferase family 4 protein [Burkholderia sp. R-69927]CAE6770806.1 Alpha-D-kanosaminyltransferase [Paraburkholderia domus]CAE6828330.1 Alpha-D-kanosaminyltransferase [Paraburkholderia domus]CAE6854446.1 Alpha-D-kanosaminyltransferase [Paraburkholderia domus]
MHRRSNSRRSDKARLIIQIGPDPAAQGGIAAVLGTYASYQAGFEELGYRHIFISSCGVSGGGRVGRFIGAWFRFVWLTLFDDVHLVHIHSSIKGSLLRKSVFALTCQLLCRKYVIHVHSGAFLSYYESLLRPARTIVRLIVRGAICVICLSENSRKQFISSKLTTAEKCRIVYNGITDPLGECSDQRAESLQVVITFLGKLSESKGLLTLLQALAALPQSDMRYTLCVGGAGDVSAFDDWVKVHGLTDRVVFKGWVAGDVKARLLADTQIFVLPSHSEGFPVAVVEAMAFGTAIVSTQIPGVIDAIRSGQDGLLVIPGDRDGLRDALWQLLNDSALRERLGASARQRFLDRFTMQQTALHLASVYDGVTL